jgi:hypothetical protein
MPAEYKSNKFRFTPKNTVYLANITTKNEKKKKKKYTFQTKILYLFQCCLKNFY